MPQRPSSLLEELDSLLAEPDSGSGIRDQGSSLLGELDALLAEPDPAPARAAAPATMVLPAMRPAVSHGARPTLEDTFGLRPMASHATGPSFNDLNDKSGRAAAMKAGRPALPADPAVTAPAAAAPTLGDRATDVGISALKGAISVPEVAIGLGDIVTGGRVGQAAEQIGLDPGLAKQILSRYYSPAQQQAFAEVDGADGVLDTVAAALANPSVIAQSVIESAPSMLGGAGIARGLAGRVAPIVAGAVGEGAVSAGLAAEQTRQASETGLITPGQAALAATSGAATGGLGVLGGKLAQRLGIADIETLLAGATRSVEAQRGLARQVLYGAIQEGLFEELPQSVQEQVLQNAAQGQPLDAGLDQAAVMGALAGVVMGGGAQAFTALAGPGGGPAPMRPVPSHETTKPQPPVEPKPIISPAEAPFIDQTPTPAELTVEELAAVRGTPADVPDNPVAQQLEAERTAPPEAESLVAEIDAVLEESAGTPEGMPPAPAEISDEALADEIQALLEAEAAAAGVPVEPAALPAADVVAENQAIEKQPAKQTIQAFRRDDGNYDFMISTPGQRGHYDITGIPADRLSSRFGVDLAHQIRAQKAGWVTHAGTVADAAPVEKNPAKKGDVVTRKKAAIVPTREGIKAIPIEDDAAKPADATGADTQRDDLIRRIVDASRAPEPEVREIQEHKGTDGGWYGPIGFPQGVSSTGETRTAGFAAVDGRHGTTVGRRQPTKDAVLTTWRAETDRKASDFTEALRGMDDDRLQSQAEYWLKGSARQAAAEPKVVRQRDPGDSAHGDDRREVAASSEAVTVRATDRGSVEIRFKTKPDADTLAKVKQAGYRWAKGNKVWYKKGATLEAAQRLVFGGLVDRVDGTIGKPAIEKRADGSLVPTNLPVAPPVAPKPTAPRAAIEFDVQPLRSGAKKETIAVSPETGVTRVAEAPAAQAFRSTDPVVERYRGVMREATSVSTKLDGARWSAPRALAGPRREANLEKISNAIRGASDPIAEGKEGSFHVLDLARQGAAVVATVEHRHSSGKTYAQKYRLEFADTDAAKRLIAEAKPAPPVTPKKPVAPKRAALADKRAAAKAEIADAVAGIKAALRKEGSSLKSGLPVPSKELTLQTVKLVRAYAKVGIVDIEEGWLAFQEDFGEGYAAVRRAFELAWASVHKQAGVTVADDTQAPSPKPQPPVEPKPASAPFRAGDRVVVDEGTGQISRLSDESAKIAFDTGGALSNWIPFSRIRREEAPAAKPAEPTTGGLPVEDKGAADGRRAVQLFEAFKARTGFPKDPRVLRQDAKAIVGGDPTTYTDAITDAVEGVLTSRMPKFERRPDAPVFKILFDTAQSLEGQLPRASRSLEKMALQQFSTPLPLALGAQFAADPKPGDVVMEPTAGTGHLISALDPKRLTIKAHELSPRRAAVLKALGFDVTEGDYLRALDLKETADVIITNPPWGKYTTGKYGAPVGLKFEPRDVAERFVAKNVRDLKDGGRLAAIMPTTMLRSTAFLAFLRNHGRIVAMVQSPPGAYDTRSTSVESILLVWDKGPTDAYQAELQVAPSWEAYTDLVGRIPERTRGTASTAPTPRDTADGRPAGAARPVASDQRPGSRRPQPGGGKQPGVAGQRGTAGVPPGRDAGVVAPESGPQRQELEPRRAPQGAAAQDPGDPTRGLTADGLDAYRAAATSANFAPYRLRTALEGVRHPKLVVEARALSGVEYPPITIRLTPRAQQLVEDGKLSLEQAEQALAAVQANVVHHHGYLAADNVGVGKAQPLTAKVLTPTGWTTMAALRTGDRVIAGDGTVTTVTGVFDRGERPVFRVVFSDGAETECCDEHLWLTRTVHDRNNGKGHAAAGAVRELREIRQTLTGWHRQKNHSIPMVGTVQFDAAPVPVDPYLLGVLLGDGHIRCGGVSFSTTDPDIVTMVAAVLPAGLRVKAHGDNNYALARAGSLAGIPMTERNTLLRDLRALGLVGAHSATKFIPDLYKFNTPAVRLGVLRGLMDTDGSVSQHGRSTFYYTVSERLADDVTFLVQSFGGTVRRTVKQPVYRHNGERRLGLPCYVLVVALPPTINPFRLGRKAARVVPKSKYPPRRFIVAADPAGVHPTRCITVAHDSHLYVTDGCVVTHNSRELALTVIDLMERARAEGRSLRLLVTTKNSDNINDLIEKELLDAMLGGEDPGFDIVRVSDIKGAKKEPTAADYVPLPRHDRAVYVTDSYNLAPYRLALQQVGLHGIVGDEAHRFMNADAAIGATWQGLHAQILRDVKRDEQVFAYFTATPAQSVYDYQYLYGLRLWPVDGFHDWVQVVTGQANEETAKRLQEDTEKGGRNLDSVVANTSTNVVGSDSTDTADDDQRGSGRGGDDIFSSRLTPAEAEQIPREWKMLGRFSSRDLWRAGTEFKIHEATLPAEAKARYDRFAQLARDIYDAARRFALLDKSGKSSRYGVTGQLQFAAKRMLAQPAIEEAIRIAQAEVASGHQAVISLINVSEMNPTEGNIRAAIEKINTRQVDKTKDGELIDVGDIPEAMIVKAELLEQADAIGVLDNPIDLIGEAFGQDNVAFVIGGTGAARQAQVKEFQAGKRQVAVLSAAGSTGISLDHRVFTKGGARGRRSFIDVQYEWSATEAIQRYGRVDRASSITPPKITALTFGAASEKKFLATIANRMSSLGALSKGGAESTGATALEEFEITGADALIAARNAWEQLSDEDKSYWKGRVFRDPNHPDKPSRTTRASMREINLALLWLPTEQANTYWAAFVAERDRVRALQGYADEARTRALQGEVQRSIDLSPTLRLYQVKNAAGHRFGILRGVVMPEMPVIREFLSTPDGGFKRSYVNFTAGDEVISGLEVPITRLRSLADHYGKALAGEKVETTDEVRQAVKAGDRIRLKQRGTDGTPWVLRQRQDGAIAIDGAKMADRELVLKHGGAYHPVGNWWEAKDLDRFIERFPVEPPKREVVVRDDQDEDDGRPASMPRESGDLPARLLRRVDADVPGFVARYRQQFGRVLNGDLASELFPEYVANRAALEREVRPAAAKVVEAAYTALLAEPTPTDRVRHAVFTSGGNGSGKSTAVGDEAAHLTFDSTLSQFDPTVAKIDRALAAGFNVDIRHTARHPVEAWVDGVLPRAMKDGPTGRTVRLTGHAYSHAQARAVFLRLADHYAGDPRVQVAVRESRTGRPLEPRTVAWLREQVYPEGDGLRTHLQTALDAARREGRISDAVYDGATGTPGSARAAHDADGRDLRAEPGRRPQPPVTPKVRPPDDRGPVGMPRNSQISSIPPAPAGKPAPPVTPRMRPSDIVAQLREALGRLPIRDRNVRGANQGQYHADVREIRVRVANELPVIFHEAGHDLDLTILKIGRKDARWRDELMALGQRTSRPSYKAWQVRKEGAAEFFRLYLMDEAAAKAQAPHYFAEFERRLDEHRDLKRLLHATRENFRGYASQDLPTRLKARIDFEGQSTTKGLKKAATDTKGWLRDQAVAWVDDLQVLKEAVEDLRDGRPLDDRHNAYTLARIARGAAGKAQAFLEYGVRGRGGQFISGSLADALKPVKASLEDFTAYLVALRTIELRGRGIETGISQAEAGTTVKAARARADYAAFEQARDAVYAYQDATIEYARQYGALSKDQIAKMRLLNQAYVPFKRVMDDVEASWGGVSRKLANRSIPIRRIKGSGRDIINPLESIVTNTHALVDMVEKNRAMLALTNQANQAPASARWLVNIPPPQVPKTVNVLEVLEGVAGRDPAIADFLAATGVTDQDAVTLFSPAFMAPQGKNIVTVIRDGKREFYQVNDQDLYDAITRIGPNLKDSVMAAMFEPFTRLLRAGATLTPEFIARNPGRDTLVAYLQSRYGFIPGLDTARGLVGLIRNDADAKLFYTSGIDQATLTGQDRQRIRQNLQGLTRQGKHQVAKYLVTHPLELLRAVSGQMEAATRLGEFKLALEAAGVERGIMGRLFGGSSRTVTEETLTKATLAARDVTTDFSRGGQRARELNRYTAFFNARVQGYVRMVETVKRDPVGTLEHLAALGAFTAALWFLNRDDEQYEELAEWEKRTYWHLKIPFTPAGTPFIRIPKPFEWAYIPDVIEAALDFTVKQDPNAWRMVKPSSSALAQTVVSLVPTAILPLLEAYTNYSTFRERPIVRPFDLNLPVEQQYSDFTSETAKHLSRVIPVAPAKLDHVLFGYTAGLGRLAIGRVDELGSSLGLLPAQKSRPAKTFEQLPVVGVFGRSHNFAGSAASIDQFYDAYQEVTGFERGLRRAAAAKDQAEVTRLRAQAKGKPWAARTTEIKAGYTALRDLGDGIDAIYDAPADKMTPAQKREALDRVRARMVDIARRALGKPGLTSSK